MRNKDRYACFNPTLFQQALDPLLIGKEKTKETRDFGFEKKNTLRKGVVVFVCVMFMLCTVQHE